jgi:hypothetical protein
MMILRAEAESGREADEYILFPPPTLIAFPEHSYI